VKDFHTSNTHTTLCKWCWVREHSTKKEKGTDQHRYFERPLAYVPTEVNLVILITVKGKLQKMQTSFFKKKKS